MSHKTINDYVLHHLQRSQRPARPQDGQAGNGLLQNRLHPNPARRHHHRSLQALGQRRPEFHLLHQRISQKEPDAARPQRQVHVRRRAMGKREPQLLRPAMGRLFQAKGRGEREEGYQGADRAPTHQHSHRILRESREVQERQTRQEHRHRRHVQTTPYLALGIHPEAIQQGAVPLLLEQPYYESLVDWNECVYLIKCYL